MSKKNTKPEPKAVTPEATAPADATVYTVGPKATKPNTFFASVQAAVANGPLTLAAIITGLQAAHKADEKRHLVPKSQKDNDMVIRVRTNYAANHGYIVPVSK